MKIVGTARLLTLSHTELKLLVCLIRYVDDNNEYFFNTKIRSEVSGLSGLKENTLIVANSKLVRHQVSIKIKNGWYKINPEVMVKI